MLTSCMVVASSSCPGTSPSLYMILIDHATSYRYGTFPCFVRLDLQLELRHVELLVTVLLHTVYWHGIFRFESFSNCYRVKRYIETYQAENRCFLAYRLSTFKSIVAAKKRNIINNRTFINHPFAPSWVVVLYSTLRSINHNWSWQHQHHLRLLPI
jgi:hypothetical protein